MKRGDLHETGALSKAPKKAPAWRTETTLEDTSSMRFYDATQGQCTNLDMCATLYLILFSVHGEPEVFSEEGVCNDT